MECTGAILSFQFDVSRFLIYLEVANLPKRPQPQKWPFVYSSIKRIIKFYLLTDACETYIARNPLFAKTGSAASSVTSQGALLRCVNIFAMVGTEYCRMSMQYLLLAVCAVAIGLTYPQDWPDVFGSWSHAYTVRQFWGYVDRKVLSSFVF